MKTSAWSEPSLALRLGILVLLPLVAGWFYWQGQQFSPTSLKLAAASAQIPGLGPSLGDFPRRAAPRYYHKDNLYEQVNGHAEFYLSLGFVSLGVAYYGQGQKDQLQVEVFDLGTPLQALGVYLEETANQKGQTLDLGLMGQLSSNRASLVQGRYYARILSFESALPLAGLVAQLSQALPPAGELEQLSALPDLGQVQRTSYFKEDYRGLDFFPPVLERTFAQRTAGLLLLKTGQEPAFVQALEKYLKENQIPHQISSQGQSRLYQVQDPFEGPWSLELSPQRNLMLFPPLTGNPDGRPTP